MHVEQAFSTFVALGLKLSTGILQDTYSMNTYILLSNLYFRDLLDMSRLYLDMSARSNYRLK